MADFVRIMKDWRRMCDTIQSKNQKTSIGDWCKGCPLPGLCIIDTSIKDSTNGEFDMIGEQIQAWAAEHPEPVYPTWAEWLHDNGIILDARQHDETEHWILGIEAMKPIPADIAQKLGIEPKQ